MSITGGPLCLVPRDVDNFGDRPVIGELDSLPCCPETLPIVGGGAPCPRATDNNYNKYKNDALLLLYNNIQLGMY